MSTENGTWHLITDNLKSRVSPQDMKLWFSKTTLESLENDLAVISVPNKFVANWLRDHYLNELRTSFKSVIKKTPEIHFQYKQEESIEINKKEKQKSLDFKNNLNKLMNFDNFYIGDYNKFAFYSAVEVSNNIGSCYNPLYIYSKSGHGKTHLLNAIGNDIVNKKNYLKVRYIYPKNFF